MLFKGGGLASVAVSTRLVCTSPGMSPFITRTCPASLPFLLKQSLPKHISSPKAKVYTLSKIEMLTMSIDGPQMLRWMVMDWIVAILWCIAILFQECRRRIDNYPVRREQHPMGRQQNDREIRMRNENLLAFAFSRLAASRPIKPVSVKKPTATLSVEAIQDDTLPVRQPQPKGPLWESDYDRSARLLKEYEESEEYQAHIKTRDEEDASHNFHHRPNHR